VSTLSIPDSAGSIYTCRLDIIPDSCPICHQGIQPIDLDWNRVLAESVVERVFLCPLRSCQHLFIARYSRNPNSGYFYLKQTIPTEPKNYSAPPELQQISRDFCEIYNQAQKAEQLGLLLVSGPGYRKALEFLVKDYLKLLQPTDEAKKEVAKLALMPCITKYVTDARMKATAERATWLGNDETHYIRKWEDKDLQDMKKFIQLTCFWIQSEHLTKTGVEDMPKGKR
jgi:hypothetical protein